MKTNFRKKVSWITKPSEPIDEAELEKILLENFGEKQSETEASMDSEKDSEPDCSNETIFGVVENIADKNTNKVRYLSSPEKLAIPRTEAYRDLIREFKKRQCRERENEIRRQKRKMARELN